jgi:hypothetical protein
MDRNKDIGLLIQGGIQQLVLLCLLLLELVEKMVPVVFPRPWGPSPGCSG